MKFDGDNSPLSLMGDQLDALRAENEELRHELDLAHLRIEELESERDVALRAVDLFEGLAFERSAK